MLSQVAFSFGQKLTDFVIRFGLPYSITAKQKEVHCGVYFSFKKHRNTGNHLLVKWKRLIALETKVTQGSWQVKSFVDSSIGHSSSSFLNSLLLFLLVWLVIGVKCFQFLILVIGNYSGVPKVGNQVVVIEYQQNHGCASSLGFLRRKSLIRLQILLAIGQHLLI